MQLIDSKTYLNLARSYAGECQAQVRYKFIEYGARYNKHENIAQIIDKIIYNEFNHARMFYTFIQNSSKETIENLEVCTGYPFKQKWNLEENLLLASEDEHEQGTVVYPKFADVARAEGFDEIAELFENIAKIELKHEAILTRLHEELKNGTLYKKKSAATWLCDSCGYSSEGKEPWEICPVCQAERQAIKIEF